MLADAIESYKRRIIMLEESLPAHEDAGIYWTTVKDFITLNMQKSLNPVLNKLVNKDKHLLAKFKHW